MFPIAQASAPGAGAEVVRGTTKRERSRIGLPFLSGAFLLLAVGLRAWQVKTGSTHLPEPNSDAALLLIFGGIALLVLAYISGKTAGRFRRRSQVRFFAAIGINSSLIGARAVNIANQLTARASSGLPRRYRLPTSGRH